MRAGGAWRPWWTDPTPQVLSAGQIQVSLVRIGLSVEVRIDMGAVTGLGGNVVYLNGGSEIIPPGLRPGQARHGAGWGDQPNVAIRPVAFAVQPNGAIILAKDPAVTAGFAGTVPYMLA